MKRRDWIKTAAGGVLSTLAQAQEGLPEHPRDLVYPKLSYDPPDPSQYRRELDSGAVAYLVEDHQLPLVSVGMTLQAGGYQIPAKSAGLAGLTGGQMRSGGTASLSAQEFDEEAAFLATQIGAGIGTTSGGGSVDCLTQNLDRSLELFFDMLKRPGFEAERLEIARAQTLQGLARRNDRLEQIQSREFRRLTFGGHFTTIQSTQASIESITREAMQEFHARNFDPRRMFFSVSGDFDTEDMVRRLNEALADGWPSGTVEPAEIPAPAHEPQPGVYMVDKTSRDVNQSHVTLGHLGIHRFDPDAFKVRIMNSILGGGGFTSRIMLRVRSDEGLAYSAYSRFQPGTYYRGTFSAGFQSRNATCAQAAAIVIEEIERMQNDKVTAQELDTAKNYQIEIFPRFFATAGQVAGTFANDEFTGQKKDYWKTYRERIGDVSAEDVMEAAQKHLHPDKLVVLAVGDREAMLRGNPDKPEFSFAKIAGEAGIRTIALPDPLTMQYPEGQAA
ncbi:MAG: pitrilysin family protein [Bryobacterales bacterium]|nr:pitrilysin family protein [Bryobacterales bacterium]